MRKLILFGLCMFLLAGVSAIEEGQVLNQSEVNALNISLFNEQTLQCRYEYIEANEYGISIEYSCLSLIKLSDNYFVIIRDSSPMTLSMNEIRRCLTLNNPAYCQERAYEWLNEKKQQHVQASVNWVLYYQTTWVDLVIEWLEALLP